MIQTQVCSKLLQHDVFLDPESAAELIPLRADQIYQYFRLATGAKIARNILRLKRRVGLVNDFAAVDSSTVCHSYELKSWLRMFDSEMSSAKMIRS